MNLKTAILALSLLWACSLRGQTPVTLTFGDPGRSGIPIVNLTMADRSNRISSAAGTIVPTYTNVPDSMKVCIAAVLDIWESLLKNDEPIYLEFQYGEPMESSANDIEVVVQYLPSSDYYLPTSLYFNTVRKRTDTEVYPDATIRINPNLTWSCMLSATVPNAPNFPYSIMRAIPISLGFGSSLSLKQISSGDIITFGFSDGYTIFDSLIFNEQGTRLTSIPNIGKRQNTALEDFALNSANIYAKTQDADHHLYQSDPFIPYVSLIYLDNPASLMHYEKIDGSQNLQVDDVTKELLQAIGWTFRENYQIYIYGEGLDGNGYASAYEAHTFGLTNLTGKTITNPSWSLSLPLTENTSATVIQSSGSLTFTVPAISNPSQYYRNINGDVYATIKFTGIIDGEEVSATYRMSYRLEPMIKSVDNIVKEIVSDRLYNVYFTVEYVGSDHLKVGFGQPNSSVIVNSFVYESYLAHCCLTNLSRAYEATVYIAASNEYGTVEYEFELPSYVQTHIGNLSEDYTVINQALYDLKGRLIWQSSDFLSLSPLPQGVYVLRSEYKSGKITSKKIDL